MLGNAHPVGNNGGIRFRIGLSHLFECPLAQTRLALNVVPAGLCDIVGKVLKALGVFGNKRAIEHVPAFGLHFQQVFGNPFQRGGIASGLHLEIGRGDIRGAVGRHFNHALWVGKTFQGALAQRVKDDNRHVAAGQLVEGSHHARMVSAGVMADRDHQFSLIKVIQRDGPFPNPDRTGQTDAGGLVTHIRAVGEVVGAVFTGKQLEQIRRFVRGASGGIELDLVRLEPAQYFADALKRRVPVDGAEGVTRPIIAQGVRESTVAFQLKVRFCQQRGDAVFSQKRGGDAFARCFPGHRFGTVFAELERRFVFFIRPRAARAVKAVRLVGAQQRRRGVKGIHLGAYRNGRCFQCAPAAGRAVIVSDAWHRASFFVHTHS